MVREVKGRSLASSAVAPKLREPRRLVRHLLTIGGLLLLAACRSVVEEGPGVAERGPLGFGASDEDEAIAQAFEGRLVWSMEFVPRKERARGVVVQGLVGRRDGDETWVVVGDGDGLLACLSHGVDDGLRPVVRWTRHLGTRLRRVRLALEGDRVAVAHAGGFALLGLSDGELLAQLEDAGVEGFGRRFADQILVGRRDGRLWYTLDAATGRTWFAEPFAMERVGAPVVVPTRVQPLIVATDEPRGRLEAYEASSFRGSPRGGARWFVDLGCSVRLGPVVCQDPETASLVLLQGDGVLRALDAERGTSLWQRMDVPPRARELSPIGPYLVLAGEEETQVRRTDDGNLVLRVPGWAVPVAWFGGSLWMERGHVLLHIRPGDEGPELVEVGRVKLPGSVGSLRLVPLAGGLLYATDSGSLGFVELQE